MFIYGIDANVLTRSNKTGTERYVSELLSFMQKNPLQKNERVLLYVSEPVEELSSLPAGWEMKVLNWKLKKGWTHGRLSWELLRNPPDVFFSPAHEIPMFMKRIPIVATVHDVAFRVVPNLYSTKGHGRQEWSVRRQIKMASKLITVSQTTKNDLKHFYKVNDDKIVAIPLAINPDRFNIDSMDVKNKLKKYKLAINSYFVTIGRLEKKKNTALLIDAFSEFKARRGSGDSVSLVLGGSYGYGAEEIKEKIETSKFKDYIYTLGFVPEEDLLPLLAGALAYVFPTNYEGFGIPALESMAAGIALIASDIPALREIAGEAAIFASPNNKESWVRAMQKVQIDSELKERLVSAGKKQIEKFSWVKTAESTWGVLRSFK